MRRVLECWALLAEVRLLSDDAATPHRFQAPVDGEDLPVALAELHRVLAEILEQDAVPPLRKKNASHYERHKSSIW